jgi:hypothetical protein
MSILVGSIRPCCAASPGVLCFAGKRLCNSCFKVANGEGACAAVSLFVGILVCSHMAIEEVVDCWNRQILYR